MFYSLKERFYFSKPTLRTLYIPCKIRCLTPENQRCPSPSRCIYHANQGVRHLSVVSVCCIYLTNQGIRHRIIALKSAMVSCIYLANQGITHPVRHILLNTYDLRYLPSGKSLGLTAYSRREVFFSFHDLFSRSRYFCISSSEYNTRLPIRVAFISPLAVFFHNVGLLM